MWALTSGSSCSLAIPARLGRHRADAAAARECRPDDIGVSVAYPLPGRRFTSVSKRSWRTRNWLDSDDLAMLHGATYEPDFYRTLTRSSTRNSDATVGACGGSPPRGPGRSASGTRQAASVPYHGVDMFRLRRQLSQFAPIAALDGDRSCRC